MPCFGGVFEFFNKSLGITSWRSQPNGANFVTDGFPAPGLRKTQRLITSHNAEGKGYFQSTDHGDHQRVMGEKQAVTNIHYSTMENPVDLNGDVDVHFAENNEVCTARNPWP